MTRIADIQRTVARYYGMSPAELTSRDRDRMFAHPRQVAMYLSRELTGHSLPVIAHWFHRHHTTVIHGIREIEKRSINHEELRHDLWCLRKKLAK